MGATARKAAETWTIEQWAGKLAAQAGPRDYIGQLRALYDDVNRRWRYVQESGERVPGTPRALLGHVLGAWYNQGDTCPDPEHCDVASTAWNQRGFGDCDDVSTLLAAGALSIGMRPYFRVARWPGGAHVSTYVETPKGERVNLDPVGEPEHTFGWALRSERVQFFDLDGREIPFREEPTPMQPQLISGTEQPWPSPTYMAGLGDPAVIDDTHVVLVRPGDSRGARVLAVPTWHYRLIARGMVEDGMPAVDQFGDVYAYDRMADLWAPIGACVAYPMGRRRRRRFGQRLRRVGRRLARRVAKVGHSKIARIYRKAAGRILRSKLVQEAAAKGLQALGIPPQATKAILEREAALARRGGRAKVAELIGAGRTKEAAALIAKVTGQGVVRGAMPSGMSLGGYDASDNIVWTIQQSGREYPVAPVAGFERVGGWYGFGQLDIADEPTPGRWYRIKKGDTFFGVIGRAFGLGSGGTRLRKTQQVNNVAANRRVWGPTPAGNEQKWFPDGRVSFNPRFACDAVAQIQSPDGGPNEGCYAVIYIAVDGEEPPPYEAPVPPPAPELPSYPEEPEEPTVEIPPEEPVIEPPEPVEPTPPPPTLPPEEPVMPAPPVEPTPPPVVEEPTAPTVVECGPGQRIDPNTGECVSACPPGYEYDAAGNRCVSTAQPQCPPGYTYDAAGNRCIPPAAPPPPVIEEPEPSVITCPPGTMWDDKSGFCRKYDVPVVEPTAPGRPAGEGGAGPWILAMLLSAAMGNPLPLLGAAVAERK